MLSSVGLRSPTPTTAGIDGSVATTVSGTGVLLIALDGGVGVSVGTGVQVAVGVIGVGVSVAVGGIGVAVLVAVGGIGVGVSVAVGV